MYVFLIFRLNDITDYRIEFSLAKIKIQKFLFTPLINAIDTVGVNRSFPVAIEQLIGN